MALPMWLVEQETGFTGPVRSEEASEPVSPHWLGGISHKGWWVSVSLCVLFSRRDVLWDIFNEGPGDWLQLAQRKQGEKEISGDCSSVTLVLQSLSVMRA